MGFLRAEVQHWGPAIREVKGDLRLGLDLSAAATHPLVTLTSGVPRVTKKCGHVSQSLQHAGLVKVNVECPPHLMSTFSQGQIFTRGRWCLAVNTFLSFSKHKETSRGTTFILFSLEDSSSAELSMLLIINTIFL